MEPLAEDEEEEELEALEDDEASEVDVGSFSDRDPTSLASALVMVPDARLPAPRAFAEVAEVLFELVDDVNVRAAASLAMSASMEAREGKMALVLGPAEAVGVALGCEIEEEEENEDEGEEPIGVAAAEVAGTVRGEARG